MTLVELSGMRRLFPTIFLLQIILRLEKQLDANKQAIKSKYLECLEKLLEAHIKCFRTAITHRKNALNNEIENLRKRIAAHNAQLTKATKFQ